MRVTLSRDALADIAAAQAYVRQESPAAAARVGQGLLASCHSLSDFAERGRPGLKAGTREIAFGAYVIIYRVTPDRVQIVRVLHHARRR